VTDSRETISIRIERRTAWVTLNRPPLNILDIRMMEALDAALQRALPESDFVVFQARAPKLFPLARKSRITHPNASAKCSPHSTPFFAGFRKPIA